MTEHKPTTAHRQATDWPAEMPHRPWKAWTVSILSVIVVAAVAFLVGRVTGHGAAVHGLAGGGTGAQATSEQAAVWTCSMHPQIRLPQPGQCPICFMDLIPVKGGADDGLLPELTLSDRAKTLAKIATASAERHELVHEIELVGKVAPDETRITYISSYVPGRLDRLFVNYTGMLVKHGDHMAEIYSPELLTAQRAYILSLERAERAGQDGISLQLDEDEPTDVRTAARQKLDLWGIPDDEIERLKEQRQPSIRLRVDAPAEGWVIERQAFEGMYVETGTRLFTMVDLHTVWVMLEAYEMDLPYLRYGQTVEFTSESLPGQVFPGRVAFIQPTVTEATRTVKVRINVPNESLQLRPGMFVRARVRVHIGQGGQVIEPSLSGKWISPMHPEIIKDQPGTCDICGMALVPAESLGFSNGAKSDPTVLTIPASAPLVTGKRAIVYVETVDDSGTHYEGRVVELGLRGDDRVVVLSGLEEGERVVVEGASLIDSALQIQARPSMMQRKEAWEGQGPVETSGSGRGNVEDHSLHSMPAPGSSGPKPQIAVAPLLQGYFSLVDAMASDDEPAVNSRLASLRTALQAVTIDDTASAASESGRLLHDLSDALPTDAAVSLSTIREHLPKMTSALEKLLLGAGRADLGPLYRVHCPMALDNQGADWIQDRQEIRNPYFGKAMLRCGRVQSRIDIPGSEVR